MLGSFEGKSIAVGYLDSSLEARQAEEDIWADAEHMSGHFARWFCKKARFLEFTGAAAILRGPALSGPVEQFYLFQTKGTDATSLTTSIHVSAFR